MTDADDTVALYGGCDNCGAAAIEFVFDLIENTPNGASYESWGQHPDGPRQGCAAHRPSSGLRYHRDGRVTEFEFDR